MIELKVLRSLLFKLAFSLKIVKLLLGMILNISCDDLINRFIFVLLSNFFRF